MTTELDVAAALGDEPGVLPAVAVDADGGALAPLAELAERARSYARGSKAANTLRAYESDLRHFGAWCDARALTAFPAEPETVALYLVDHAERLAVSTLRRRLAAISEAHQAARFSNPTVDSAVRVTWAGIRRAHGTAPDAKEAAVTEVVAAMVAPLGERLIDVRDRAVLLVGFAGALRRSELSGLDVGDVVETGEGLKITVARSKTDQEAEGHTIGITYGSNPPTCPVRAWRAWLEAAEIEDGPAFRRLPHGRTTPDRIAGDGIARMVKRRAVAAGYAPELFSGHSLRSGFATTAARAGVAEHRIMRQGRWTTSQAMRGYIHEGELFVDNPSAKLGL
ncbi:tyrosine-type recombinase/integrase [Solirubrobacter ginsenosidimutans]|uniref:Tyrosine-type recombinase/integrase n=1 Tax=Solirubrobacter ginsenosidimutans TaxID=490573 RepID=A0A9X3MU90_9ACTN|nr:tyrosine-type recombinase/integrase [Solirubrobacter ginsenosidimutans]MDA0163146.1 tyrosine-type recombinase/integrase [Solirubrobacter ginsenosidimutans]